MEILLNAINEDLLKKTNYNFKLLKLYKEMLRNGSFNFKLTIAKRIEKDAEVEYFVKVNDKNMVVSINYEHAKPEKCNQKTYYIKDGSIEYYDCNIRF